jgi:hypothetical protein
MALVELKVRLCPENDPKLPKLPRSPRVKRVCIVQVLHSLLLCWYLRIINLLINDANPVKMSLQSWNTVVLLILTQLKRLIAPGLKNSNEVIHANDWLLLISFKY